MLKNNVFDVLKYILVILFIVVLGVAAVNQVLEYKYKSEFLQRPCELCARLNQPQAQCIGDCFNVYSSSPIQLPPIQVIVK
jgi:hypothetical protein